MNPQLNPTLWRTCRALCGRVRLALLRQIISSPGLNVSELAERIGIGVSDASQELRRLQSRGLLKRSCQKVSVVYLPIPDPQVASAAPLLAALKTVLADDATDLEAIARMARGLGHERRIQLVRALRTGPGTAAALAPVAQTGPVNLKKHLNILKEGGWVGAKDKQYMLLPAANPFMSALLNLL